LKNFLQAVYFNPFFMHRKKYFCLDRVSFMQAVGKITLLLAVGRKECYVKRELSQCRVDLR